MKKLTALLITLLTVAAFYGSASAAIFTGDTEGGGGGGTTQTEPAPAECGNGILETREGSEECDYGINNSDSGVCHTNCRWNRCGDGLLRIGYEQCDDGNTTSGDGCSRVCSNEFPICGNGVLQVGEACDDGNSNNGDGCSSSCEVEVAEPTPVENTGGPLPVEGTTSNADSYTINPEHITISVVNGGLTIQISAAGLDEIYNASVESDTGDGSGGGGGSSPNPDENSPPTHVE